MRDEIEKDMIADIRDGSLGVIATFSRAGELHLRYEGSEAPLIMIHEVTIRDLLWNGRAYLFHSSKGFYEVRA